MAKCLANKDKVLESLAHSFGKLMTNADPMQRSVAAAFYAELLGKMNCDVIWLDAIVNTLYEAKADSSLTVRKLATIGLTKIVSLQPKQVRFILFKYYC